MNAPAFSLLASVLTSLLSAAPSTTTEVAPPISILVLPVQGEAVTEDERALLTRHLAEALKARGTVLLRNDAAQSLDDDALAALVACTRGSCLEEAADKLGVDAVVFSVVKIVDGERPVVLETKVFDREKAQVVSRAEIDGPDVQSVDALVESLAAGIELPVRELPPPPPIPVKKSIFENPVFVAGVAVTFIGGMAVIGGLAYAVQADQYLADPELDRALKSDALRYGVPALYVAAGGAAVTVVGAAIIGLAFVLPEAE